jgi:hypothetical protein
MVSVSSTSPWTIEKTKTPIRKSTAKNPALPVAAMVIASVTTAPGAPKPWSRILSSWDAQLPPEEIANI